MLYSVKGKRKPDERVKNPQSIDKRWQMAKRERKYNVALYLLIIRNTFIFQALFCQFCSFSAGDKNTFIKQLEIYEWWQREEDISAIYRLRQKLAQEQTNLFTSLNQQRMEKRMKAVLSKTKKETEKKLAQIERKKERELRKLAKKRCADRINDLVGELGGVIPVFRQKKRKKMIENYQMRVTYQCHTDFNHNTCICIHLSNPKSRSVFLKTDRWILIFFCHK